MKKNAATCDKAKRQRADFARECHYTLVEETSLKIIDKKKRSKRLDIIVEKKIKKGSRIKMSDGSISVVRCINFDGIIHLNTWDEIDPLDLVD